MPQIYPFQGWRYNQDMIEDLSKVVTPPYDVISPNDQDQYYAMSPYNFVRLILNKAPGDERYTSAAQNLEEWKKDSIILRDDEEIFYLLSQTFETNGQKVTRSGIIAELQIEPLGPSVMPHEQTIEKHITDRYKLMETTKANFGQIFMSYRDQDMTVESIETELSTMPPLIDVVLGDEVRYRIWPIAGTEMIDKLQKATGSASSIILDGHHRYKTALKYSREYPDIPGSNRVMVNLVNAYNPGLTILPTHRMLKNVTADISYITEALEKNFTVQRISDPTTLLAEIKEGKSGDGDTVLGIYHRASETSLKITFQNKQLLSETFPGSSDAYRNLDLNILHHFVLKEALNLDTEDQADLENIEYIRGKDSPVDIIHSREDFDILCLVMPPELDEVFAIAEAGETMPQKSTYFYPKVNSGLVLRCFG